MKRKHAKEKSKLNVVLLVLRIICIVVIIVCLIYIFRWYLENKKNADMLKNLKDSTILNTTTMQVEIPDDSSTDENPDQKKIIEIPVYELDFPKLLATNNSTVGWIKVPNTSIDYPVAQASNNDFYLNHSFDNSSNTAGWIFADYRNKFDGTDKNIIIYGHNRMDTSMFATLKITQKDWWYNNNKYLTFTTPTSTIVYEVFSSYTTPAESYYLTTSFANDESYLEFLNTLKSRSVHDFGVELNPNDSIITLSTCDASGNSRVIVHAKRIN